MKSAIDIDIQIDAACDEPKVVIRTSRMTPEIENIIHAIEACGDADSPMVTVYNGSVMLLVSQWRIVRVFIENRRLIVKTEQGDFVARGSLAEMEARLDRSRFQRISRSEIINLYRVSNFDFGLSGTIHVRFTDGSSTWVARRYVRSIKQALGLK